MINLGSCPLMRKPPREALKGILGEEIRLIPENGILVAEMQTGGLAAACKINVVAGARSGHYLTHGPVRIPLKKVYK